MPEEIPPEVAHQIAPVMEKVMGQLVRGGGLKNGFSITGIAGELSGVAMSYQLAIPPYFGLVLRAFSVIEGIALKVRGRGEGAGSGLAKEGGGQWGWETLQGRLKRHQECHFCVVKAGSACQIA
jgi:predicted unusual protein kinase regulating ubiquinone biosynthesis (AarF/ABC1/UbiB family)